MHPRLGLSNSKNSSLTNWHHNRKQKSPNTKNVPSAALRKVPHSSINCVQLVKNAFIVAKTARDTIGEKDIRMNVRNSRPKNEEIN